MRRLAKKSSRRCALAITAGVALWLHADPSAGARLTAVRVGSHPGYTRVVLQTDAPAAFQLLEESADAPGEVTVRIAAASSARDVTSREPGAPRVELLPQADGTTLARIRASGPLRVETQVLATPPRLVLDLRRVPREGATRETDRAPAQAAAAALPAPTPERLADLPPVADPVPVQAPETEPTPAPVADPAPVAAPPTIAAPEAIAAPAAPDAPPPVGSPPRAGSGIDPTSLAWGLAAGLAIAAIAVAASRRRTVAAADDELDGADAALETDPFDPIETGEVAADPEIAALWMASTPIIAAPEDRDDWMLDVLRMHQRLDARLAEIAGRLSELDQRQARLEARGGAQNEEIASQRAAIARLQRSLRPATIAPTPRQVR